MIILLLRALVVGCLSLAAATAESFQWSSPSGGNWNDANNWTPSQVPASGDTATIPAGGLAIVINTTVSINGLTLGGGSSLSVASSGVFNILGNLTLDGPLTNAGTVNWQDGVISVRKTNAATGEITNEAGGLFDIRCDKSLSTSPPFGAAPQFRNAGILRKSVVTGTTQFSIYLDNGGTVEGLAGILRLTRGSNLGGIWQAATDAQIILAGGSLTLSSSPNFQGPGIVRITSSNVTLNDFSGAIELTNSPINGRIAEGGVVNLIGGSVTSSSSLSVAHGGVFNILGTLSLSGPLTNAGTVSWQDGDLTVGEINNVAGGLFDIRCDRNLTPSTEIAQFHNAGTLRKSAGAGNTEVYVYFDNTGAVEGLTGMLRFNSGTNLGGTFQAAADAVVDVAGSNLTLSVTPPFQGPGTVRITTANVAFDNFIGTADLSGANVSGQLAAGAILNLHGGTVPQGASLSVASGGVFNILGSLNLRGPLTNTGTVNWQDGDITVYNYDYYGFTGEILNQAGGLFDIRCDRTLSAPYGGQFHNAGTLRKSAGAGNTEVYVYFDNTGAVEGLTGMLRFNSGYSGASAREFSVTLAKDMPARIWISGSTPASLSGTFTVRMEDGYRPNPGDRFPVLNYPGAVGDFTCLNGLDLGQGLRLEPRFNRRGLTLVATPYVEDGVPTPYMIRANQGVFISWPDGFSDWGLYRGTDLANWQPTPVAGINNTVKPVTETREYFRLQKLE